MLYFSYNFFLALSFHIILRSEFGDFIFGFNFRVLNFFIFFAIMAKYANCSSSVSDIRSMNYDELSSFSLGLIQDENINLASSNIQSKGGVILEKLRSKQWNDPQKSAEIMKRKAVRKSLSPKSTKNQKIDEKE